MGEYGLLSDNSEEAPRHREQSDGGHEPPQRRNCDHKARNCSDKLTILHGMVCMEALKMAC